jgi:hypothetical protein
MDIPIFETFETPVRKPAPLTQPKHAKFNHDLRTARGNLGRNE